MPERRYQETYTLYDEEVNVWMNRNGRYVWEYKGRPWKHAPQFKGGYYFRLGAIGSAMNDIVARDLLPF